MWPLALTLAAAAAGPVPGGLNPREWRGEIVTLPSDGASDSEPTTGNGIVAVALNSRGRFGAAPWPSTVDRNHTLQLYIGSNNLWEFLRTTKNYTSKYFPAAVVPPTGIGNRVALGGLSISIAALAGPDPQQQRQHPELQHEDFYAEERVATGQVFGRRTYSTGAFELTVSVERSTGTILTSCIWLPKPTRTWGTLSNETAVIDFSTWATAGRPTNASLVKDSIGVVTRGAVERDMLASSPLSVVGALATTLLPGKGARRKFTSNLPLLLMCRVLALFLERLPVICHCL